MFSFRRFEFDSVNGTDCITKPQGAAWALEATKKRVVQVGLKWFICDTGYNVSFDGAINFHSDADVWIDKACIDLGYIQNMGPLSLNVACGLGRNTVQPRVGLGFNF